MRKIIVPYSAAEEGAEGAAGMDALDSILSGMDGGDQGAGAQDQGGTQQQNNNDQQNQDGNVGGDANQNNTQRSAQDKQNFAFGQMRTQITELTNLLGKIANANGIEYTNNKDLLEKLNDDAIGKMAQKQNVPVELLREVEALRQDSQAFKAQQLRDAAALGFQNLMNTYGLTQQQLQDFAVELDARGKNPFTQNVDLLSEYKVMHFDEIVASKVEKAVQEALAKSGAADQHSSTPGNKQGSNGGGAEKISTVAGLTSLLDELK